MSTTNTTPVQQLGRSPRLTAGVIAQNAVPDVEQALALMKIPGAAYAAGVNEREGRFEGLVHISLGSSDAYDFARWVRSRATGEDAAARVERQQEEGTGGK